MARLVRRHPSTKNSAFAAKAPCGEPSLLRASVSIRDGAESRSPPLAKHDLSVMPRANRNDNWLSCAYLLVPSASQGAADAQMVGSTRRVGGRKCRRLFSDTQGSRDGPRFLGQVRRNSGVLEGMERGRPTGIGAYPARAKPNFTVAGIAEPTNLSVAPRF